MRASCQATKKVQIETKELTIYRLCVFQNKKGEEYKF